MSADDSISSDELCASCGIAAVDDIKLKMCDGGCDLVKYCSLGCQELHRPEHKNLCRKRLIQMMHDDDLFNQPDISCHGECPICFLPLSLDPRKSTMMTCCCKVICNGCDHANAKSEVEQGLEHRCAFCREPMPKSQDEADKNIMERIKKNDPAATTAMGKKHYKAEDYVRAAEYWTEAAELGYVEAHFSLGTLYYCGDGVEKDTKKAVYHWEQASIGGHTQARAYLAEQEIKNGRFERAAKHYIIAANLGHDKSLKAIKDLFVKGKVSKEEYAAALRAHQAAVDATKSAEREEAEAAKFVQSGAHFPTATIT